MTTITHGKVDEAAAVQNEICRIIYAMCAAHGNLYAVLKAILAKRGVDCGSVRKPLPALIESDLAIVDQAAAHDRRGHRQILLSCF